VLNFKFYLNYITLKNHTLTHTAKYLHIYKFWLFNNWEYIKCNLIFRVVFTSGHRVVTFLQTSTSPVLMSVHSTKKITVQ